MSIKKFVNNGGKGNLLVLHRSNLGCCGDTYDTCQYTAAVDVTQGVDALTIQVEGEATVFEFPSETTIKGTRIALAKALEEAGFDAYYKDTFVGINITADSVTLTGEAKVVSIRVNGSDVALTEKCEMGKVCKFSDSVAYDTDAGLIGATQIGTTNGFAAGQSEAVKTAWETALNTEGIAFETVNVIEDDIYGLYTVEISVVGGDAPYEGLTPCGCTPAFV